MSTEPSAEAYEAISPGVRGRDSVRRRSRRLGIEVAHGFPTIETRTSIAIAGAFTLLFQGAIHLRVHLSVPLPSEQPLRWFAAGLAQDIAVLATVSALALFIARAAIMQIPVRLGFGVFATIFCLLSVVQSEAVTFLGSELRPEDFRAGIPGTVLARSIESRSGFVVAITAALLIGTAILAAMLRIVPELAFLTARRAAIIALAAFCTLPLAARVHRVDTAENPIVALLTLGHDEARSVVAGRTVIRHPAMTDMTIRDLLPQTPKRWFVSDDWPLAYIPPPESSALIPVGVRPNIVFFVVESLRAEEAGCYGADPPGITPNLDALARDGIKVDPFYSPGTFTASAETAVWYGLPPIPNEVLLTSRPELQLSGLPEILRSAGWKSLLWIHDGDFNFYRRDLFYKPRGFRMVDGSQFPATDPQTNWGYSDRSLARRAVEVLDRTEEPFASMVLTVTNHHPYQLPSDAGPPVPGIAEEAAKREPFPGGDYLLPLRTAPMIQTVHYSDEALGDFIAMARSRPWFAHTIVVVMGDHGITIAPLARKVTTAHTLQQLLHRVPLVIYSPMLKKRGITIHSPGSQVDVPPTVLAMAGVKGPWSGLGSNLLDPNLDPDRPVFAWSTHTRTLSIATRSRIYYASYAHDGPLTGQEPIELLVNPERDPTGSANLLDSEPNAVARFRHLAKVYTSLYPWLVAKGRTGIPR